MNRSVVRISLDVHRLSSREVVRAKKGDSGRQIQVLLRDGSKPYLLGENSTAALTAEKPDGNIVYDQCAIADNMVICDITEQLTAVPGEFDCELKLYDADGKFLTSPTFRLQVEDTIWEYGDEVEDPPKPTRLLMAPHNCRVGQYFKIAEVNADGTAVRVEAVDSPGGGYYMPSYSQADNVLTASFKKSEHWMPDLPEQEITIPPGNDGASPYIGPNGHWWIGDVDSGVDATASGVWLGSEPPPEGYDVWIDPNGDPDPELPGGTGGYYVPAVTQPDATHLTFGWTPSQEGMPQVEEQTVELPGGQEILGAYELLHDLTVEVDVSDIAVDIPPCVRLSILYYAPVATATRAGVVLTGDDRLKDIPTYSVPEAYSTTGITTHNIYRVRTNIDAIIADGYSYVMSIREYINDNTARVGTPEYALQQSNTANDYRRLDAYTYLRFNNYLGIPAGTNIKIWGIKK